MYNNQINQLSLRLFSVLALRLFCDYSHIQQSFNYVLSTRSIGGGKHGWT